MTSGEPPPDFTEEVSNALRRRITDDFDVRQHDLVQSFQAIVERSIGGLREEIKSHMLDPHAHPDANQEQRSMIRTLWDERNETKGMIRVIALILPIASLIGPLAAIVVAHFWR